MSKINEIICHDCNGCGEIIDNSDEWVGTQIEKCETCDGIGMIEVYNGMQVKYLCKV